MDDRDFEALVARHGAATLAFLRYRTRDADLAEDLLADTFERALRARGRFDPRRGSGRAWLAAIALNVWRDHARRAVREHEAVQRLAGDAPAASAPPDPEERLTVLAAVARLPEPEQEVVALVYGADLKAKQVADLLEVPVTTVNGRLYRALRRLKSELPPPARG